MYRRISIASTKKGEFSLKGETIMKTSAEKTKEFLDMLVDWQAVETETIERMNEEMPKARNPLIKTLLQALKLEAEKRCAIQQMIVESIKKEAVNLSPEELSTLSGYLNRHFETAERALSHAEAAIGRSELFIPHYLLAYLISDLKKQNSLLRQLDGELKTASIPTSATAKIFASSLAA